jgi:YVTN family beta-propeller protein
VAGAGRHPSFTIRSARVPAATVEAASRCFLLAFAGSTAVVLDSYAGQVSLINTSTQHVYAPITVGSFPTAVAISG